MTHLPTSAFATHLPFRHLLKSSSAGLQHACRPRRTPPVRRIAMLCVDDEQLGSSALDRVETFHISSTEAGERLDKVLHTRFPGRSRSYFQTLLKTGLVTLDDKPVTKSAKPSCGDKISLTFNTPAREQPLLAESGDLCVLYEDEHMIAINKPAGMVVHPAPGNWSGTLVNLLAGCYPDIRELGGARPGVVHRLDRGTSGVILVARTESMQRQLAQLFADRKIGKEYLAVTVGNPAGSDCLSKWIAQPIGRSAVDRLKMDIVPEEAGGRDAKSLFQVLAVDDRRLLHLCKVRIVTGRTHQIRVHARYTRTPVLGDELYGALDINKRLGIERTMLHAWRVTLKHPVTGAAITIETAPPSDMARVMETIRPRFREVMDDW